MNNKDFEPMIEMSFEPVIEMSDDGSQVIKYPGSITTVYPDGRIVTRMDAGHIIDITNGNSYITVNWDVVETVELGNLYDVASMSSVADEKKMKHEVVFKNKAVFRSWYDHYGALCKIECEGGSSIKFSHDGTRLTINQPQSDGEVTVH